MLNTVSATKRGKVYEHATSHQRLGLFQGVGVWPKKQHKNCIFN